jgi:NifU-like protein involved in Fe-S cluster formation
VTGHDGVSVRFHAEVDDGRVTALQYEATSCATLVAYAELLGDLAAGEQAAQAARITAQRLVATLPGVPAARHDRAELVIRAWWSALARALEHAEQKGIPA